MASAVATGGGVTAMLAEHWRCVACTPAVAAVWLPARLDHPTLEWEVASPSVSRSW
jgi:hypothetical protein